MVYMQIINTPMALLHRQSSPFPEGTRHRGLRLGAVVAVGLGIRESDLYVRSYTTLGRCTVPEGSDCRKALGTFPIKESLIVFPSGLRASLSLNAAIRDSRVRGDSLPDRSSKLVGPWRVVDRDGPSAAPAACGSGSGGIWIRSRLGDGCSSSSSSLGTSVASVASSSSSASLRIASSRSSRRCSNSLIDRWFEWASSMILPKVVFICASWARHV